MRTWLRVTKRRQTPQCGSCGRRLALGDPMLRLIIGRIEKLRCQECADEPVPADLPELSSEAVDSASAFQATRRLVIDFKRKAPEERVLDWKLEQVGDREPGQEG